jgi:hypothetical protein
MNTIFNIPILDSCKKNNRKQTNISRCGIDKSLYKNYKNMITCCKQEMINYNQYKLNNPSLESNSNNLNKVNNEKTNTVIDITVKTAVTIKVPIIFHIMFNTTMTNTQIINHINSKIIPVINNDFNRNKSTFTLTSYTNLITQIFSKYPNKLKMYIAQYSNLLQDNSKIKWNFYLQSIQVVKTNTVGITGDDVNDNLIKNKSPAINPDSILNIWIAPSRYGILGISRFPWDDKLANNNLQFDPRLAKYHGILIATNVFGPTFSIGYPYAGYKTFSHEIGHYFGMLHTFDNITYTDPDITQDNINIVYDNDIINDTTGDLISDTPYQFDATVNYVASYNAGTSLHMRYIFNNTNNYQPTFFDFMDYSVDSQLFFFTIDQQEKMIYMIKKYFPKLIQ